jgi:hypothetical protein
MKTMLNKPTFSSRICARLIDYCLFFSFSLLVTLTLPIEVNTLFYLILGLAVPTFFFPVEALLLSFWGKTPGKALFGISVKEKPSFKEAFSSIFFRKKSIELTQKSPSLFRFVFGYAVTAFLLTFSVLSQNITTYTIGGEKQQKISGWVHYVSEEAGFHVDFPTDPKLEEKEVSIPRTSKPVNYNEYVSQKDSKVKYAVSYLDIPRKWSFVSSKRILKGVFDVVMKLEPHSILVSKEYGRHLNFDALNFHYQKGGDEIEGRLIRIGQRLFKITVTYPASISEKPVSHEFINSFHIGKPENQLVQELESSNLQN